MSDAPPPATCQATLLYGPRCELPAGHSGEHIFYEGAPPLGPAGTQPLADIAKALPPRTRALLTDVGALLCHISSTVLPGEYRDPGVAPNGIAEAAEALVQRALKENG